MAWRTQQAEKCPRCLTFDFEDGEWEADVHTCPRCHDLDSVGAKLRDSAGSTKGQSVRLYRGE